MPIAMILALAGLVLQAIDDGIKLATANKSGVPMTKDQVMAILQADWNGMIGLNLLPANLQAITWSLVQPIISKLYDLVFGIMGMLGAKTVTPDVQAAVKMSLERQSKAAGDINSAPAEPMQEWAKKFVTGA